MSEKMSQQRVEDPPQRSLIHGCKEACSLAPRPKTNPSTDRFPYRARYTGPGAHSDVASAAGPHLLRILSALCPHYSRSLSALFPLHLRSLSALFPGISALLPQSFRGLWLCQFKWEDWPRLWATKDWCIQLWCCYSIPCQCVVCCWCPPSPFFRGPVNT